MYVTWELILSICAGFSAICLSVGYLIKIIKAVKKPAEDIKGKVSDNKAKIDDQEDEMERVKNTLSQLQTCPQSGYTAWGAGRLIPGRSFYWRYYG